MTDPAVAKVKALFSQPVLDAMRRVNEGYPSDLSEDARLEQFAQDAALVGSTLDLIFVAVS